MGSTLSSSGVRLVIIIDDATGTTTICARVQGRPVTLYNVPIAWHNEVAGALKLVAEKEADLSMLDTFSPVGITWW